jgi:LPXTG-motif cell wall-anchored protein
MKKMVLLILTAALLLASMTVTAFAHEVPDLTENGTITLTIIHDEKELNGGELELYRVGDIQEDDGDYSFVFTAAFGGDTVTEADLDDPALAAELEEGLTGTAAATAKIENGKAVFTDVAPGLYLVHQKTATPGFAAMNSFLLSMPNFVDGKYETEISATPKVGLETLPPTRPTGPTEPSLPQTGQLNWPIPVLAVLGLALVSAGFVLKYRKKSAYEE